MKNSSFLSVILTLGLSFHFGAARGADAAWQQLNFNGIQKDVNTDAWNAGRLTDVITQEPGAGILVAAGSGVWSIGDSGSAIPLSDDWDQPILNCLARGLDGSRHYFAGGESICLF